MNEQHGTVGCPIQLIEIDKATSW